MKTTLFIFLLAITAQFGFAQYGAIEGRLVDEDGVGSEDCIVILPYEDRGIETDKEGRFRIDSLLPGQYRVEIYSEGGAEEEIRGITVYADSVTTIPNLRFPPPCPYDRDNNICTECGRNDQVIPIVYGYPGHDLMVAQREGKVALGGCVVSGCDPHWYCKRDSLRF